MQRIHSSTFTFSDENGRVFETSKCRGKVLSLGWECSSYVRSFLLSLFSRLVRDCLILERIFYSVVQAKLIFWYLSTCFITVEILKVCSCVGRKKLHQKFRNEWYISSVAKFLCYFLSIGFRWSAHSSNEPVHVYNYIMLDILISVLVEFWLLNSEDVCLREFAIFFICYHLFYAISSNFVFFFYFFTNHWRTFVPEKYVMSRMQAPYC